MIASFLIVLHISLLITSNGMILHAQALQLYLHKQAFLFVNNAFINFLRILQNVFRPVILHQNSSTTFPISLSTQLQVLSPSLSLLPV